MRATSANCLRRYSDRISENFSFFFKKKIVIPKFQHIRTPQMDRLVYGPSNKPTTTNGLIRFEACPYVLTNNPVQNVFPTPAQLQIANAITERNESLHTKPILKHTEHEWIPSHYGECKAEFNVDRDFWFKKISFIRTESFHPLYVVLTCDDKDVAYKELKNIGCVDMPKESSQLDGWISHRGDIATFARYLKDTIQFENEKHDQMLREFLNYNSCPLLPEWFKKDCNCLPYEKDTM